MSITKSLVVNLVCKARAARFDRFHSLGTRTRFDYGQILSRFNAGTAIAIAVLARDLADILRVLLEGVPSRFKTLGRLSRIRCRCCVLLKLEHALYRLPPERLVCIGLDKLASHIFLNLNLSIEFIFFPPP